MVAIVDSGVQTDHPDLASRMAPTTTWGRCETGSCVAYTSGNTATYPVDGDGHGTHVAGIVAATTDNGIGVAGVAGERPVNLIPIKVLNDNGDGTTDGVAAGIAWAVAKGAKVIQAGPDPAFSRIPFRSFEGDVVIRASIGTVLDHLGAVMGKASETQREGITAALAKLGVPQSRIDEADTVVERFMIRWRGEPDPAHVRAVDAYFVSAAEHGMNASTFTARVIASASTSSSWPGKRSRATGR